MSDNRSYTAATAAEGGAMVCLVLMTSWCVLRLINFRHTIIRRCINTGSCGERQNVNGKYAGNDFHNLTANIIYSVIYNTIINDYYSSIVKKQVIPTAKFLASLSTPRIARVCVPLSPKTARKRSDAPSAI